MKKIVLAEDRAIVVKAIEILLEAEFGDIQLNVAGDEDQLDKVLQQHPCGLAIISTRILASDSVQSLLNIKERYPTLDILIFSGPINRMYAHYLRQKGFKGHLHEGSSDAEIVCALNRVFEGNTYFPENPVREFNYERRIPVSVAS
jgi:DNA-binding NarL/FixJ family response regulator